LKTRLVDISDLMATMDVRRRVAWDIARDHGWEPTSVSVWVIVAPGRTNERILSEHRAVLRAKFPSDGRSIRRWIGHPTGSIAGLSFLATSRHQRPRAAYGDAAAGPAAEWSACRARRRPIFGEKAADRSDIRRLRSFAATCGGLAPSPYR
jgi:hypothetical protein